MSPRYYDTLRICREASDADIRSAYRRRALQTHPDKGGSPEDFLAAVLAVEKLVDRRQRKEYDALLLREHSSDGLHPDTISNAMIQQKTAH